MSRGAFLSPYSRINDSYHFCCYLEVCTGSGGFLKHRYIRCCSNSFTGKQPDLGLLLREQHPEHQGSSPCSKSREWGDLEQKPRQEKSCQGSGVPVFSPVGRFLTKLHRHSCSFDSVVKLPLLSMEMHTVFFSLPGVFELLACLEKGFQ